MGHLGLLRIYKFKLSVRAKEKEAQKLISDAKLRSLAVSIVLEKSLRVSEASWESVRIPIIGIGAGSDVDGQVLVVHDLIGLTNAFNPRFLRRYMNLFEDMKTAIENYVSDVKSLTFKSKRTILIV